MFYDNYLNLKDIKYTRHKYKSFSKGMNSDDNNILQNIDIAKNTYNYDYSSGKLKDGIGINIPKIKYSNELPTNIKTINFADGMNVRGCWLFPMWDKDANIYYPVIVAHLGNNKIYYNFLHHYSEEFKEITGITLTETPVVISYKNSDVDVILLITKNEGIYSWNPDTGIVCVEDAPMISSMALYKDKLFYTCYENERGVYVSDNLDPTSLNRDNSTREFLECADEFGKSNKVVSFNGYLYNFRDYNITRITAYSTSNRYEMKPIYLSSGKIYHNTIAICGDKIVYLASDGVYSFDGNSVTKIELKIDNLLKSVDNKYAHAGYSEGFYYLSCKLNFDDEMKICCEENDYINNALLKIKIETNEISILRGYDIRTVHPFNDDIDSYVLVTVVNGVNITLGKLDMSGEFYGVGTHKVWESNSIDFGYPDKYKLVKEIYINTKSECFIDIKFDNRERIFKVKGENEIQKIPTNIKGKLISISIISNVSSTDISHFEIKVGV